MDGKRISLLAVDLIEERLNVLPISLAAIASFEAGQLSPALQKRYGLLRKPRLQLVGSGGNIVAERADVSDKHPDDAAFSVEGFGQSGDGKIDKSDQLRVTVGNAVLAVGAFMQRHDMLSVRTPEVQFLGHVLTALLNANRFSLPAGYMPSASFDGLVINPSLNGTLLFDEGPNEGFMTLGDAIALLQWLSRYLRGEMNYVSAGDAG